MRQFKRKFFNYFFYFFQINFRGIRFFFRQTQTLAKIDKLQEKQILKSKTLFGANRLGNVFGKMNCLKAGF